MGEVTEIPAPIPVVTVTARSPPSTWRRLEEAIDTADFIALDLELSGLGNRKALYLSSVEDRYTSLCTVANTHAVISVGVACFKWAWSDTSVLTCQSSVYDLLLICQQPYLVDPASLHFLISHGFDFNRQYAEGIPFSPPPPSTPLTNSSYSFQDLFLRILDRCVPIAVHNGLIDLIFLYRSFYAPLPSTLSVFVADLSEMFPGGVFDTKNIAEGTIRETASFLEYIFHKCWRENYRRQSGEETGLYMNMSNCDVDGKLIPLSPSVLTTSGELCSTYSTHGYCRSQDTCPHSHNILHVLNEEEKAKVKIVKRKRKRKKQNEKESIGSTSLESLFEEELAATKKRLTEKAGDVKATQTEAMLLHSPGHRAGTDAYMTGYSFACYGLRLAGEKLVDADERGTLLEEVKNKITLGGKPFPLLLTKSSYTTTSQNHRAMTEKRNKKMDQ